MSSYDKFYKGELEDTEFPEEALKVALSHLPWGGSRLSTRHFGVGGGRHFPRHDRAGKRLPGSSRDAARPRQYIDAPDSRVSDESGG